MRDTDVTITQVSYRMHVSLSAGTLTVFGRGRQIYTGPIVVGTDAAVDISGPLLPAGILHRPEVAHDRLAVHLRLDQQVVDVDPAGNAGRHRALIVS